MNRVYNQVMEPTAYSQMDRGEPWTGRVEPQPVHLRAARVSGDARQDPQHHPDRFGNFTCGAFKKHGFRQVGYWHNRIGGNDHQLTYLLAWESLDEQVAKFDTFAQGPGARACVRREREGTVPIVQQVANVRPTAFSPMK